MKAFQAHALDSIDDYRIVELATPEPGPGQVRVRIKACGVGYVDALTALGRYQVKPKLPFIPGNEASGIVDALGEGVTGFAPGDRVIVSTPSAFCEYACVPASAVVKFPDAMSFAEAAGFRVNYFTALHGLRDRADIKPGEKLLVIGAAGGVGIATVQIGALLGAEVIAVGSTEEKRAFARANGAHHVIDTNPEGWRDRLKAIAKTVHVVMDPVCGPLFELAFRSLAWRGRHLVVGFTAGKIPALPANLTLMKGAALMGVDVRQFGIFEPETSKARADELFELAQSGRLHPVAGRIFPFAEAGQALEFAYSGASIGKTIIEIP